LSLDAGCILKVTPQVGVRERVEWRRTVGTWKDGVAVVEMPGLCCVYKNTKAMSKDGETSCFFNNSPLSIGITQSDPKNSRLAGPPVGLVIGREIGLTLRLCSPYKVPGLGPTL
jgi:hypothetical protein